MPALRAIVLVSLLAGTTFVARALTYEERDAVCPIGGETFKTTEAMSGSQFGMFLDLKPFGPIAAPWPIAKCPGNGFVIYKEPFSPAELVKLSSYVEGLEYQSLQRSETNYYLASRLQRVLNASPEFIAFSLLRATWEATEGDQYTAYAAEALAAFVRALEQPHAERRQWLTEQLVATELERRLSRFSEAKLRLAALSGTPELSEAPPVFRSMVDMQTKLVAEQDAHATMVPRPPK